MNPRSNAAINQAIEVENANKLTGSNLDRDIQNILSLVIDDSLKISKLKGLRRKWTSNDDAMAIDSAIEEVQSGTVPYGTRLSDGCAMRNAEDY